MTGRAALWMLAVGFCLLTVCPDTCNAKTGRFWHVTDFHYDVNYTSDGNPEKMCWASPSGSSNTSQGGSGPGEFGDYLCDAPWKLVESAVDAMVQYDSKPDFILWTGDDTAHVDNKFFSTDKVVEIIKKLTDLIRTKFPTTQVFPVLGNHDSFPKNQVPPGVSDLQTKVAEIWKHDHWLNETTSNSFRGYGRYVADVPGSKVSILALNTLIWYKSNNYTALDPNADDPSGQFEWADTQLRELDRRRRRVYVIGHIPPGTFERYQQKPEGFHWYQERYNTRIIKLIQDHSHVIEAQFFAHHHTDSFRLFFDKSDNVEKVPVSYQLLAPGVTPWKSTLSEETGANNPGIRLISHETTTGKLREVSTYYLNLDNANQVGSAKWVLEYNFTSRYNLTAINPFTLYNLATKMKDNNTLFDQYYRANTVSLADPSECDRQCRRLHWCAITEIEYDAFLQCNSSGSVAFSIAVFIPLLLWCWLV